jgi:MOSC domain-containing protein YiiM
MDEIREGLREALEGQRGMLAHVIEGGMLRVGHAIEIVN